MRINPNLSGFYNRSPSGRLIVSMLIILAGGTMMLSLFLLAGNLIFNGSAGLAARPDTPGSAECTRLYQVCTYSTGYLLFYNPRHYNSCRNRSSIRVRDNEPEKISSVEVLLVALLAVCAFPVTGLASN